MSSCAGDVPYAHTMINEMTKKKTPANNAVPRIARGILRWGSSDSPPDAAAPSKPAKDRNPITAARASAVSVIPSSESAADVGCWPCGPPFVTSTISM